MSISWVCCQSNMGVPFNRLLCLQTRKGGTLSVFFWVSFLRCRKRSKRTSVAGREKEREEIPRIAYLMGRAKKRIEDRLIEKRERQNKAQRRWHSSLSILSPLFLPSLFLFEMRKTKRKNYEKEKGKERNRRDRPRGGI